MNNQVFIRDTNLIDDSEFDYIENEVSRSSVEAFVYIILWNLEIHRYDYKDSVIRKAKFLFLVYWNFGGRLIDILLGYWTILHCSI